MNRIAAIFLAAAAISLFAAAPAGAAQVGPVTLNACAGEGSCSLTETVRVDQALGLRLSFKVTNAISTGNSINVEGPVGTKFNSGINAGISWQGTSYSASPTVLNDGRRLQIPIPSALPSPITNAATVVVNAGFFENDVIVPPVPGSFIVDVWTSADTDRRASSAITTTVGLPSSLTSLYHELSAVAGESFVVGPVVRLADSRGNSMPGQQVTFTLPESGPGGVFAGGASTATAVTDSSGVAAPAAPLTASGLAGAWQIAFTGPGGTSGAVDVETIPAAPDAVDLDIEPAAVPADGTATAEVKIRVLDEFGNIIQDREITLDTDGGPSASSATLQGDGSYTATLTATTIPGEFTISATVSGTTPTLSTTTNFVQEKLPPSEIELALESSSIAADGASSSVATARVRNRLGATVPGTTVAFASDGGNEVGPTIDLGDGLYAATVRSTTTPGEVTITAAVEDVPDLFASSRLTQIPVPAPAQDAGAASSAGAPVTRIVSGPKGKIRARKARFVFASPSAANFRCRLGKAAWKRCGSPAVFRVKPGRHVFRVRAVAADGTLGPVVKRSFKRLPPRR